MYAPTWYAISNLAASDAVAGVKFPKAVRPTLRKSITSSRNLCGTCPVQSLFFLLDRAGSMVVASPVGNIQVVRKISQLLKSAQSLLVSSLAVPR